MATEIKREQRDLVTLYAERMRDRGSDLALRPHTRQTPMAVRQFGRDPIASSSRSRFERGGAVGALVATALIVGTQGASAAVMHEVQPGETLSEIAARYDTTVAQLATINGLPDPDFILAGTNLTIEPDLPADSDNAQVVAQDYEVQPGDTLWALAQKFGVTVEDLAARNGIADPNLITVGAQLVIPAPSAASESETAPTTPTTGFGQLHMVMPGETLMEIAQKYDVTVEALAAANGIEDINLVLAGSLLQIPAAGATESVASEQRVAATSGGSMLQGMPIHKQALSLSCESSAVSLATAYWGNPVSEWVFIENLPYHPNPHHGFRGNMTGPFGGTTDYGVYAKPFVELLARYGYTGEMFYAAGNADLLKAQIDQGRPVVVWMTNMASVQERTYEWYDGERFVLVPQQHAVVVYGYDQDQVYIADVGDGAYRSFSWADFMRSWGYFDGMSLAVYPA